MWDFFTHEKLDSSTFIYLCINCLLKIYWRSSFPNGFRNSASQSWILFLIRFECIQLMTGDEQSLKSINKHSFHEGPRENLVKLREWVQDWRDVLKFPWVRKQTPLLMKLKKGYLNPMYCNLYLSTYLHIYSFVLIFFLTSFSLML